MDTAHPSAVFFTCLLLPGGHHAARLFSLTTIWPEEAKSLAFLKKRDRHTKPQLRSCPVIFLRGIAAHLHTRRSSGTFHLLEGAFTLRGCPIQ
jgi:hypothetical protein